MRFDWKDIKFFIIAILVSILWSVLLFLIGYYILGVDLRLETGTAGEIY